MANLKTAIIFLKQRGYIKNADKPKQNVKQIGEDEQNKPAKKRTSKQKNKEGA